MGTTQELKDYLSESAYESIYEELGFDFSLAKRSTGGRVNRVLGPKELGEGDKPNFSLDLGKGDIKDFGGSDFQGDIFDAVQMVLGLSLPEAVKWVAGRAGIALGSAARSSPPAVRGLEDALAEDLRKWEENLWSEKGSPARQFLSDRGLSEDTIRLGHIGYRRWAAHRWVVIPHRLTNEGGTDHFKMFAFNPQARKWTLDAAGKKIIQSSGKKDRYELLDRLPATRQELLYCEGEIDALIAAQHGFRVACDTAGAGTIVHETIDWIVEQDASVYLAFDNDDAGAKGAEKRAALLHERGVDAYVVSIPGDSGRDINDVLREDGIEGLDKLLGKAVLASALYSFGLLLIDGQKRKRLKTAKELCASSPPTPPYLAEPFFMLGAVTCVVGKVKASGKTTFLLRLARQVSVGGVFLGHTTIQGPVVFLSEQPPASLSLNASQAEIAQDENIYFLPITDVFGESFKATIEWVLAECRAKGAKLLIIDTLMDWAGWEDENSASEVRVAMSLLKLAASTGMCVVFTSHGRKSGGSAEDAGRGSSNIAGQVDMILQIKRREGNYPVTQRVFVSSGRFPTPGDLIVDFKDNDYEVLGSPDAVGKEAARDAILSVLPGTRTDAMTRKDLEAALGDRVTQQQLNTLLPQLAKEGALDREKESRGYVYWSSSISLTHKGKEKEERPPVPLSSKISRERNAEEA